MSSSTITNNLANNCSGAEEISRLMTQLIHNYLFRDKNKACCYDISATEYYALCFIVESKIMTVQQLSKALSVNKSNASRAVSSLVKKGYFKKKTNKNDARCLCITATTKGQRLLAKIKHDEVQRTDSYIKNCSSKSVQALKQILENYIQHLDSSEQE